MSVVLTSGQDGNNPQLLPVLERIRVAQLGPGRPRTRPQAVVPNKDCSRPSTRRERRQRKVRFISLERIDQADRRVAKGYRGGCPSAFDEQL